MTLRSEKTETPSNPTVHPIKADLQPADYWSKESFNDRKKYTPEDMKMDNRCFFPKEQAAATIDGDKSKPHHTADNDKTKLEFTNIYAANSAQNPDAVKASKDTLITKDAKDAKNSNDGHDAKNAVLPQLSENPAQPGKPPLTEDQRMSAVREEMRHLLKSADYNKVHQNVVQIQKELQAGHSDTMDKMKEYVKQHPEDRKAAAIYNSTAIELDREKRDGVDWDHKKPGKGETGIHNPNNYPNWIKKPYWM